MILAKRKAFIEELLHDFAVYPFTSSTAFIAGKIDGQKQSNGLKIPANDLLIAATPLDLMSQYLQRIYDIFRWCLDL